MHIKKFIIGTSALILGTSVALFAHVIKKGRAFENSLDKTGNALDESVLFSGKNKIVGDVPMQDLKLGAFYGGLNIDLSGVQASEKQYDLEIKVDNGFVNVIVPENFHLNVTDRCRFAGICDDTIHPSGKEKVVVSVYADICQGVLHFENPIGSHAVESLTE